MYNRRRAMVRKWLLVVAFLSVLGLTVAGLLFVSASLLQPDILTTLTPSRQATYSQVVIEDSLGVEELWRKEGFQQSALPLSTGLLTSKDQVVIIAYDPSTQTATVYGFDSKSGDSLWEISAVWPVHSLEMEAGKLYVAHSWRVHSYDSENGNLIWRGDELPDHTSYRLRAYEPGVLQVLSIDDNYGRWEQVIRYYRVETGELASVLRLEAAKGSDLKLRTDGLDFWSNKNQIWATDVDTGLQKWVVETAGSVEDWPILYESTLIVFGKNLPGILSFERQTGLLKWSFPARLSSTVVMDEGLLYAIIEESTLVAVDPTTGKEVGRTLFTGSGSRVKSASNSSWIAASRGMVFIYFPDTQELISLQRTRSSGN